MESKKKTDFDTCYRMYAPKMYGVAFKMVSNHHDALDIVQESFIKAFNNWEKFRGDAKISTWLFRITLNQSYDFLRKKQKERSVELEKDVEDIRRDFGESKIIKEDVWKQIKKEIDELPPRQKAVFV
ncbi:RNA polymerase sigma factor, partial [bacterium]|nr:RNA polymerase sigma factor [bacterium]